LLRSEKEAPVATDERDAAIGMTDTLRDNIRRLSDRERSDAANAPASSRIADAVTRFTGSMTFVALHLLLYGAWIAINVGAIPPLPRFDPSFVILAMEASVEAIFLSTFVLISQNRMADASRRRAELDLHVNLLAEHELTRVAELVDRIARRLDIDARGEGFEDVKRDVEPIAVMDALEAERRDTHG
jgi:uncharacterized membrane protein